MKDIVKKSRGMPRRRLQHIYDMARTRTVCEGGNNKAKNLDSLCGDPEEMIKQTVSAPLINSPHLSEQDQPPRLDRPIVWICNRASALTVHSYRD